MDREKLPPAGYTPKYFEFGQNFDKHAVLDQRSFFGLIK